MRDGSPFCRERGSALVYVLWISLIVSILMAGSALIARTLVVSARVERTVLEETLALRSALDLVAYRGAIAGRSYLDSLPEIVQVGGFQVRVAPAPMNERIDINLADETVLRRLFERLGASQAVGASLTDQILDWRDSDTDARPQGVEADDLGAGEGKSVGNRLFLAIEELGQVRDITPARLACMAPYLTVFGGTGSAQSAPPDGADLPARSDGVRMALRATLLREEAAGRSLTGLVIFGTSPSRPFEWVWFGDEDGLAPPCPDGAF